MTDFVIRRGEKLPPTQLVDGNIPIELGSLRVRVVVRCQTCNIPFEVFETSDNPFDLTEIVQGHMDRVNHGDNPVKVTAELAGFVEPTEP